MVAGASIPSPRALPAQHVDVLATLEAPWISFKSFYNSVSSPVLPQDEGQGWKFLSFPRTGLSGDQPSSWSYLRPLPWVTSLTQTHIWLRKGLVMSNKRHSCDSGNSRGFTSSVLGTGDKTKYYFVFYHGPQHIFLGSEGATIQPITVTLSHILDLALPQLFYLIRPLGGIISEN